MTKLKTITSQIRDMREEGLTYLCEIMDLALVENPDDILIKGFYKVERGDRNDFMNFEILGVFFEAEGFTFTRRCFDSWHLISEVDINNILKYIRNDYKKGQYRVRFITDRPAIGSK